MSKKTSLIIKAIPFVLAVGVSVGGFLFSQLYKDKNSTDSSNDNEKEAPPENKSPESTNVQDTSSDKESSE